MALVGYSDSEGSDSDSESPNVAPATTKSTTRTKGAFQKLVDPAAPRKIKVDLPTTKPDLDEEARPAKKPRTGGFGGFNSFLPAPKRTADAAKKQGLGSGVNLKTGAEPAFSREPVDPGPFEEAPTSTPTPTSLPALVQEEAPKEAVKPVGNAMKFKPLSVARKKTAPKKKIIPGASPATWSSDSSVTAGAPNQAPPSKPKVSLFSVSQDDDLPSSAPTKTTDYQPLLAEPNVVADTPHVEAPSVVPSVRADPNSLGAIADDLNLSASARRQLFGRNKDASAVTANITHFNIDDEYARNEQLRAQGEAFEHRAVKAVAPGKHSLQQLVSAATSQKEALEDAWAEGKKNKAEGGSRYGW